MSVFAGVEHDLKAFPPALRKSALAQGALALAKTMDDFETEPAEMASCFRALQMALAQLRALAPPEEAMDAIDELGEKRTKRRAGVTKAPRRSRS